MLRVHFLNVGHGDCTIIKHHSGRLTMIDINNSQDYDSATFNDIWSEENQKDMQKASNSLLTAGFGNPLTAGLGIGGAVNDLFGVPQPRGVLSIYADAIAKAKSELTDPIDFIKKPIQARRYGASCSHIPISIT